jgi:hypothetical protein
MRRAFTHTNKKSASAPFSPDRQMFLREKKGVLSLLFS